MNPTSTRTKSVALTFRGFEMACDDVVDRVGVVASRLGNRGEPVKAGVKTLLTRSYVIFSVEFASDFGLNEMFPILLARLGGLTRVTNIRNEVLPEFLEIHFDLPVLKFNDESQEGYLSEAVIADIYYLKASLSLGFF